MTLAKGENPNHPDRGSTIKVEPIWDVKAIRCTKKILVDKPRDLCLFTFGINNAYRANEILSARAVLVPISGASDRQITASISRRGDTRILQKKIYRDSGAPIGILAGRLICICN